MAQIECGRGHLYDPEKYATCPYCNTKLEFSNDLEDFILSPLISHWIQTVRNRQEAGRESYYRQ